MYFLLFLLNVKDRIMRAELIIIIAQLVIVSDVSEASVKTNFQQNDMYFYDARRNMNDKRNLHYRTYNIDNRGSR